MNATELLQNVQFVLDTDGNKTAVQIDYAAWEELLTLLEDIEDNDQPRPPSPLRRIGISRLCVRRAGGDVVVGRVISQW